METEEIILTIEEGIIKLESVKKQYPTMKTQDVINMLKDLVNLANGDE